MQGGVRARKGSSYFFYLPAVFCESIRVLGVFQVERGLQGRYERTLVRGFARGEFKAEFAYTYIRQPLFDHGKSRLFFSHEQHAFAFVHGIGYHIGNCLTLARAGRAVQYESGARGAFRHRFELRTVAGQRSQYSARVGFVLALAGKYGRGQFVRPRKQGSYERIFLEDGYIVLYVAPHGVARKSELRYVHVLRHFPTVHLGGFGAEERQRLRRGEVFVLYAAQIYVEFPLQKFQKSGVYRVIFVAYESYSLAAVFLQGYGQQDKRRVFVFSVLFPLQKAQGEAQGIRARFFLRRFGFSYQRRAAFVQRVRL